MHNINIEKDSHSKKIDAKNKNNFYNKCLDIKYKKKKNCKCTVNAKYKI